MARALAASLIAVVGCSAPATPDAGVGPWAEVLALPEPRLEPGVAALGQRLIVLGGFDQDLQISRDVFTLDLNANDGRGEWTTLAEAPVARTHVNLAAGSATLYLLGGLEGEDFIARGDSYALDTDLDGASWREIAPMPLGFERGAAGIVVAPPHIYLLGGASATSPLATCLDYDFALDSWSELPPLPAAVSHPAATRVVDGTLIVAGGLASLDSTQPVKDVWALSPRATGWAPAWERRADMQIARGGCAYGTSFGQLVCAGGEAGAAALSTVERYDTLANAWSFLDPMPEPRAGTPGATIGSRLFVPGGAASLQFRPTSTVFVLSTLQPRGS